jgi:hypothetical protein
MVRRSFLSLVAISPLGGMVHVAPAAPTPLRTLVYDVLYSSHSLSEEATSGFTSAVSAGNGRGMRRAPTTTTGDATVQRRAEVTDDGRLTVDVVAATKDGGLVVDAAFAGKVTTQPPIRVAIFPDGRLSYDPRLALSAQAARVLPFLARGLLADHDVSPGSTWNAAAPFPGARGSTLFRVTHVQDERADLTVQREMTVTGPRGFSEQDHGNTSYAIDRLCPLELELDAQARHSPSPDQYVTETAHLSAKLISDTFAKHAP